MSSKLKAMRIKGYIQIRWLKICLTSKYINYVKTDFLLEKIFNMCSGEKQS